MQIAITIWPDDFAATSADIEIRFGSKEVVGKDAELLTPSVLHAVSAPGIAAALRDPADWQELMRLSLIQAIGFSSG